MNKGVFVSFEGPDGAGKSTIIKMLYDYLVEHGNNVVLTREPGGTNNQIAEDIRQILLNKMTYNIDYRAEALLFAASRAQHVADFIKPNISKGNIVLCDRYIDSSLIYQGMGRKLGVDKIWEINEFAMNGVIPSITFVLMIEPELGIDRILKNKNREFNRLDAEKKSLHRDVYEGYKSIIASDKTGRIIEIDASGDIKSVFDNVLQIFKKKLNL